MTKIYLLDHRSEIFQTFSDANGLFAFCNRSTRNMKGKTLIVLNESKSRVITLGDELPTEILKLTLKLENEIR